MKTRLPLRLLAALTAACLSATTSLAQAPENLLPEGAMIGEVGKAPRGWESSHPNYLQRIGATVAVGKDTSAETPGNFVTFTNPTNTQLVRILSQIEIQPTWVGRTLVFRARMRAADLGPGSEGWHMAGIHFSTTKADGKTDYSPGRLQIPEANLQWRPFTSRWKVPADVNILHIGVGLLGATGTLQVRDVEIFLE